MCVRLFTHVEVDIGNDLQLLFHLLIEVVSLNQTQNPELTKKQLVWLPDCSVDPDLWNYRQTTRLPCIYVTFWDLNTYAWVGNAQPRNCLSSLASSLLTFEAVLIVLHRGRFRIAWNASSLCLPSVRATGVHLQSHPPILLFRVKMLLYNKNISVFPISQFMANIFLFSRLQNAKRDTLINTMIHWSTNTSMRAEHSIFLRRCV